MRERVVILRPLGLGDFLTGVPAYRGIRARYPQAEIVLAAPRSLAGLVTLTGAIDRLVETEPLRALPAQLHDADVAIDLHGRGPASQRVLLDARPNSLVAFANDAVPETRGMAAWRADEHEVTRWCRMLGTAGIVCDPSDLDLRLPRIIVPSRLRGATLIHPGAASESRRWPIDRWIAVARAERLRGRPVLLTGAPSESALAHAIAGGAGISQTHIFAGRTSVTELAALVASSGRVICTDTGVAHLATAFRRPSVVLFGPTPPQLWGPPTDRPYHRILWTGSTGDPHGSTVDRGLLEIRSADVLDALEDLDRRGAA